MAFAKRHYIRVAEKLRSQRPEPITIEQSDPAAVASMLVREQWRKDVTAVADAFQEFEPQRFNRHAFLDAAGWKDGSK